MKVYVSSVIDAPAQDVWSIIRDFNGLPQWTPFVAHSRIEGNSPSDAVGCVRNFELRQGGTIREQLLALSDYDFTCVYSILESPMGVSDYVATLRIIPVTDGDRSFVEWSAEFGCDAGREDELRRLIGQEVFLAALKSLQSMVRGQTPHGV
ncbi:SRPBCC family protein [Parapusillimonas sp. JC17]|uniref:SRPBCC family protein n=1 Tax=Parapusillimonas sp. JC17 TaxID=3445768 RepID=UPI003FA11744